MLHLESKTEDIRQIQYTELVSQFVHRVVAHYQTDYQMQCMCC